MICYPFYTCRLCAPHKDFKFNSSFFTPVKAVAVDMFAHTDHCEMICVFERKLKK